MLMIEGLLMLLPCLIGMIYHEKESLAYLMIAILLCFIGKLMSLHKPQNKIIYAKEGFVVVAAAWIFLSIFGAIPFCLTGEIPSYVDAQWSQLSKLALFYFFGNKRVSFLLVVKYNYLFIILFPLLLLYNVVKKEGASMFVRVIKNNKGKKNTCFCALVESYRDSSGVPKHRVLINFGQVDEESVPFLKAAFAKKKPRLVYDDE